MKNSTPSSERRTSFHPCFLWMAALTRLFKLRSGFKWEIKSFIKVLQAALDDCVSDILQRRNVPHTLIFIYIEDNSLQLKGGAAGFLT